MPYEYNPILKKRAQELRRNQTDAERKLWRHLRNRQIENTRWNSQKPIGNYIVDFYCHGKKLVVEVDGSQHVTEQKEYDLKRAEFLESLGLKVLRYYNNDVLINLGSVLDAIRREIIIR